MRPADLDKLRTVSRPHLHPDAHRVAFEVTQMDFDEDRYTRRIWLWDHAARPFTSGPDDASPRWSPGGERLAFLRKVGDHPAQVAVLSADGGEADVITDFDLGVSTFEWSPGGDRLAVVATTWIDEWADLDDEERVRKPRVIDHAVYRRDNHGWAHDRRSHVWLVDPSGQTEPARATNGDADESAVAWHPDGSRIALLSPHDLGRRLSPGMDIVEVDLRDDSAAIRHREGGWAALSFDRAGRLHAVGVDDPWAWPTLTSLWRIDELEPIDLTGHLDRSVWSFLLAPEMASPHWLDEDAFLIGLEDAGRVHLIRMASTGEPERIVCGDRYVTGYSATKDAGRIVFTASDPASPGELWEVTDDGERPLTDLNADLVGSVPLRTPDHFRVAAEPGGAVEIDVWVMLPDGHEQVPVLLNIHGGPASQYGFTFFDEFQIYTGAGFAVVACNPRGSSGRGRDYVRAVTGDGMGKVDVSDVTRALDAALARHARLDPDRVGIMGGSYGGFLTAWILTQTDRFGSAVVERALLNWESFSGTSDIAPTFSTMYLGTAPPPGRELLGAVSPVTLADRITTPTLIVHSENDFRCPIEQAEQLFMTLLRTGVDTAMLRFPGESHELSRSGAPRHRVERFEAIIEWHRRHLNGSRD